jgi:transcriptional regulator with XRE-family HTH domain
MTVGECVRTLRVASGLSQRELARRATISSAMLSLVEADKREPTISMLRRIAHALDVPSSVVFSVALASETKSKIARDTDELVMKIFQLTLTLLRARNAPRRNAQSSR